VEWPVVGVPLTSVQLDGAAISAAAARAVPFWPDDGVEQNTAGG
jgi:hypothetical protein